MSGINLKLCVIVATHGRAAIVEQLLCHLGRQSRPADGVILSMPRMSGKFPIDHRQLPVGTEIVEGELGSCAQRNAAIDAALPRFDVLIFFDDDFVPHDTYLEQVERLMTHNPDWAVLTGRVLLDGVRGAGYTYEDALRRLGEAVVPPAASPLPTLGAYGCNMVVRSSMIGTTRFDTNLPLYGWQEDIDFSVQLGKRGKVIQAETLLGVHLGTKVARARGKRLGYSQVANPVYLVRKGTMPVPFARKLIFQNVAGNLIRSIKPEPYIDRRGRLAGNVMAIVDLVRGEMHPAKILSFK